MSKEITRHSVLKALREYEKEFKRNPRYKTTLKIKRYDWHEDAEVSIPFDVEVNFTHPNYQYLISKLYKTNKNDNEQIDLSLMPRIKAVVEQLKYDKYLKIETPTEQELSFRTKHVTQPTQYDEIDENENLYQHLISKPYNIYKNARGWFSEDELEVFDTKIILTPKGLDPFYDLKKNFFTNPIKWLKFIFACLLALASAFIYLIHIF